MSLLSTHRRLATVAGVFLAIAVILSGVWLLARDSSPTTLPPAETPGTSTAEPEQPSTPSPGTSHATMTVRVFFHQGSADDPTAVTAVRRTVPKSPKVATAALRQLVSGPTRAERHDGYWSPFSKATAGMLRGVKIKDRVGYADFRDYREELRNSTSSAGSAALLAELNATFKQFGTVRSTVYSINGDVPAFYEWLQMTPPDGYGPTLADARRAARAFLTDVVGMRDPVVRASRWRSDFIATVDVRAGSPTGPISTVTLGKGTSSFTVLGVTTRTIVVDRPAAAITPSDLEVVTSPMTISGRALTFEGNVAVRVLEIRHGTVRQLGTGQVLGGGDVMRPFTGRIPFATPKSETGWVLAFERSARDGRIVKVTAVRVAFVQQPS